MSFVRVEKIKSWCKKHIRIPLGVKIAICILPAAVVALFYALRPMRSAMDFAVTYISAPLRSVFALLSSIYPFAIMEIIAIILVIFFFYYVIKSIRDTSRRRGKWKHLGKRFLPIFVVALYLWGAFSWLWSSGYHATGFAERYGFSGGGGTVEELTIVAEHFAERANELAEQVPRDAYGRYSVDRMQMFNESLSVFDNISQEFPSLSGRLYRPKAMLFSWLMSITGYSGMYFALTGEAMINVEPPGIMMPATVAHEHAHQLGVFSEDEANFVAILACITSENAVFMYAGYLKGLNYLLNALAGADGEAWHRISDSLTDEVRRDRLEVRTFWAERTQADTGIEFLDNILTNIMETTSDVVDRIYDAYLRGQGEELGILSYGAVVDILIEYFVPRLQPTQ
ncbi:MAG: DUF3810 domain-containing protein [Oscillospiraceae bacterium]|nr:DUF3810 domain-containing protein [Oscillospiraceae bacterium]MCL2279184.1 DUF3810 domain-containing protein [Oscillospiraceae bacterium]